MKIVFRKLQKKESNSYRELRLECLKIYPENFGSNYHDEKVKDKLFFQPYIENSNTANFVIGGFDNEKLIALCGFHRYEAKKTRHRGTIIQVYVKQEYQGKNIGLDILKSTLNKAFQIDGIEQIELGVITTNSGAEKTYKKLGFKEYGVQKNYLKIGSNYFDHKMMVIYANQYNP
ncbi:RimJ/RimL family protein N-acetyltransferase [Gillisia sp. Hel_I_86]|uniref:GNAT family N-acetyltransferase n=1 Tax=Gillisia sp. Hel_I_86 TaxID=1249981 RepID=UPI00119B74CE|nr:GNAT family protein [Gillisia sp. Hel_I_86]TVZ25847.1 RimJ/RimL family protein N-acetyltransferase [Gillisia sp. Hel_I_86]